MELICVKFPKSLVVTMSKSETEVIRTIKEIVGIGLYRRGEISLGKAAEIVGVSRIDMRHLLSLRKTPINYEIEDLESNLKTLDMVMDDFHG